MTVYDFAQCLGLVSFGLGISTFYQENDRRLKIVMLVFNLNHLVHFVLLGSPVSALSTGLSACRTASALYTSSKWVAGIFVVIGVSLSLHTAEHWYDLWSMAGMTIGTIAIFTLTGIAMRVAFIIGAVCWLINNILVGSIGGTLLEATLLSINSLTIYRLARDKKRALARQAL
ncbi:YgjV family protein [Vibrio zhugei]|uniref:YgjV family protein n=1 Tax=Vibrio zhugei TaxID=2479546 RepID=A0ABV7CDB0_9VIBR|nr:YgjV family protein [Vibrio zhugei]